LPGKSSISVVIPTYNRAGTLVAAIESVLRQTYPVTEILVCDDGSNDNSKELVTALNNPIVKWLDCGRNGRPAIPRNKGIQASSGEWIAFLDSDDEWLPEKIEKQILLLSGTGRKAACANAYRVVKGQSNTDYLSVKAAFFAFKDLLETNYVICSSMMVGKDVLRLVGGFPEEEQFKAIEDYFLWLKVSSVTQIDYVARPFVNYLDDPTQSIRKNDSDPLKQKTIIYSSLLEWLDKETRKDKEQLKNLVKNQLKKTGSSGQTSMTQLLKKGINLLFGK
jgi:teichuronic acid biosynthesis glycosyltransferase TuaG